MTMCAKSTPPPRAAPVLVPVPVLVLVTVLVACNDQVDTGIGTLSAVPWFAVHRSDYESAAIALLDADGALLDDSYISSGTETPGLNAALHGDVALPTVPCDPNVLTVLARFGGDYVLEVDLERGEVMHQVPTQRSEHDDEAAYRSNPQDILCLPEHVALVTRFGGNQAAVAGDIDQGDDIAVIDLEAEEIVDRIDLSAVRTMVESTDLDGNPNEERAFASPGGIARVGRFAVVGLGRFTATWVAAPGMIAVVDIEARALQTSFEVEGLRNCVGVMPVADRDDALLVQCLGYPHGDAATAGIVLVSVDDEGVVREEAALRDQEAPALFNSIVSLGGTRLIAVALGDWMASTGDEAVVLDLTLGARTTLFTSDGPGAIGSGAYARDSGLLLIPDAEVGVRLFEATDDELTAGDSVALDPALPARTVRALGR